MIGGLEDWKIRSKDVWMYGNDEIIEKWNNRRLEEIMNTIAKYFNTLKYLKFIQFYNRFIFKICKPNLRGMDVWKYGGMETTEKFKNKVSFPKVKDVLFEENRFCFLNEERIMAEEWKIRRLEDLQRQTTMTNNKTTEDWKNRRFEDWQRQTTTITDSSDDKIINGWNDEQVNKLWLYNLHYFDYLRQENITSEQRLFWIEKWIDENKTGYGNGWEPYTLSLRIVNWIKFYLAGNKLSEKIIKSLAIQTEYLSKKIEYHLLANHLLANAKALVFAGLFFTTESCKKQKIGRIEDLKIGRKEVFDEHRLRIKSAMINRAKGWLEKGLEIYKKQLSEQILNDGGHFERSAMYHSIILEDLLDLKNISAPLELDNYIQKMLDWLSVMIGPDEKISLFNDAAFGIALEPNKLFAYAKQLGYGRMEDWKNGRLEDTGYARLQNNNWTLICDGAPLGPDYQLGHSHADTLTFELWYKNEIIICDTGTKQYFNSDIRKYQRGTAAHNTIVIDGKNSSQVWSAHRTAKRAKIIERNFDNNSFSATHNGYKPILHKRKWYFENDEVYIADSITAEDWKIRKLEDWKRQKQYLIEVFFHIHPNYNVDIKDGVVKIFNDKNIFGITIDKDMEIFVIDGTVSFEFGKEEKNKIICFKKKVNLPFNLKTKIFTL